VAVDTDTQPRRHSNSRTKYSRQHATLSNSSPLLLLLLLLLLLMLMIVECVDCNILYGLVPYDMLMLMQGSKQRK